MQKKIDGKRDGEGGSRRREGGEGGREKKLNHNLEKEEHNNKRVFQALGVSPLIFERIHQN